MSGEQNRAAEQMTGSLSYFSTHISATTKTVSSKALLIFNNILFDAVFADAEMDVEKYDRLPVICSAALFCLLLIVYPIVS